MNNIKYICHIFIYYNNSIGLNTINNEYTVTETANTMLLRTYLQTMLLVTVMSKCDRYLKIRTQYKFIAKPIYIVNARVQEKPIEKT